MSFRGLRVFVTPLVKACDVLVLGSKYCMRLGLDFKTLIVLILSSENTIVRSMYVSHYHKNSMYLKIFERSFTLRELKVSMAFNLA